MMILPPNLPQLAGGNGGAVVCDAAPPLADGALVAAPIPLQELFGAGGGGHGCGGGRGGQGGGGRGGHANGRGRGGHVHIGGRVGFGGRGRGANHGNTINA